YLTLLYLIHTFLPSSPTPRPPPKSTLFPYTTLFRSHVSNALGDIAAVTLKRDADDFGVLHDGAATIARINLRADLNGKVLINRGDRKSTRLNSSHVAISYAVFCLKKKNINCSSLPYT